MDRSGSISVVIPAYNCSQMILGAVESVLNQTYQPLEIIVVDDGSDEDLEAVLPMSKIRLIKQSNRGAASARNKGIENAKGEWIAFLDSDDRWMPEKIQFFMELVGENPNIGLIASNVFVGSDESGWRAIDFTGFFDPTKNSFEQLYYKNFIVTSTAMVRRSLLEKVGMFDCRLVCAEDYKLWLSLSMVTEVGFCSEFLTKYCSRESGLSKNVDQLFRDTFKVLKYFRGDVGRCLWVKRLVRTYMSFFRCKIFGIPY